MTSKPNLYQGQPLPLSMLTSESFEDFAHQTLLELGKGRGFEIVGGPQNSSDHGFDLVAKRTSDDNLICIQCKRYNSTSIGVSAVGKELAKVAINSHLEGSIVKEHYLLTTGSLTKELNSQLRSKARDKILAAGLESIQATDFKKLISVCEEKHLDVEKIITSYITDLEKILVWSGRDFDNNLGTIWSAIGDILERHFRLDRVLSEHPRPNFNLKKFINEIAMKDDNLLDLIVFPSSLPANISKTEPDGFPQDQEGVLESNGSEPIVAENLLSKVPYGHSFLFVGHGGSGKTTSLVSFQRVLANKLDSSHNTEVPVYIRLAGFRANLDDLIHDSLGITYGHWSSLPYKFFLLLDGLDEISTDDISLFTSQITRVLRRNDARAIISLRNAGLQSPASIPSVSGCYSLRRLDFRQIIKLSELRLNWHDSKAFIEILRNKEASVGAESFTLPFGLMTALEHFKVHKKLPDNLYDILIDIIKRRIKRNKARKSSISSSIKTVSESTVMALAESLAFEIRVVNRKTALYQHEAEEALVAALQRLKTQGVFGSSSLSDDIAFSISIHYEMQRKNSIGLYVMDHDLISDCLSAKLIAKHWKEHIDNARSKIGWDAWIFASRLIPNNEKNEFIKKMLNQDLVLAALCCREMGGIGEASVEKEIESNTGNPSLGVYANAMYAASILKTKGCLKLLKDGLSESDPHKQYNARRFLAISGDENFLRSVLKEIEKTKAAGLNPSGGNFNIWFEAPVETIAKIAREQVDQYLLGQVHHVPVALETLEVYGDSSDFNRIKAVFHATGNLTEFYISSRCLLYFDRDTAVSLLQARANNIEGDKLWLYAMNVLNSHGFSFDVAPLFNEFISTYEIEQNKYQAFEDITKILSSNSLPINAASELLKLLDNLDRDKEGYTVLYQFHNIWEIATAHKYKDFADKALMQLDAGTIPEISVSLTYGSKVFSGGPNKVRFIEKCLTQLELLLADQVPQFYLIRRLLVVLTNFGELSVVIKSAEKLLREHTPRYFKILKNTDQENKSDLDLKYEQGFPELLTSLSGIKHELDPKLLSDLIGVDICHRSNEIKDAYGQIIGFLPRDVAEARISQIKKLSIKIESLDYLLKFEKCDSIKKLFIENLPLILTHHFYYSSLATFAKIYWDDEVRNILVEEVVKVDWGQKQVLMQMFERTMEELAYLFRPNDVETLLIPMMNSITNNSATIYMINLWIEFIKAKHD